MANQLQKPIRSKRRHDYSFHQNRVAGQLGFLAASRDATIRDEEFKLTHYRVSGFTAARLPRLGPPVASPNPSQKATIAALASCRLLHHGSAGQGREVGNDGYGHVRDTNGYAAVGVRERPGDRFHPSVNVVDHSDEIAEVGEALVEVS